MVCLVFVVIKQEGLIFSKYLGYFVGNMIHFFFPMILLCVRLQQVFFRAAMAILKLSEPTLLQLDLESIMAHLSQFPSGAAWVLEKDKLVPAALSIKVTAVTFVSLFFFLEHSLHVTSCHDTLAVPR